mgnify:CR=1 FL=1
MALFDLQEPAALRIREAATRGTLSHALLLTGSGDRLNLARYAAAALECEADGGRPCGVCRACRKVEEEIHPDVITVRDDGRGVPTGIHRVCFRRSPSFSYRLPPPHVPAR